MKLKILSLLLFFFIILLFLNNSYAYTDVSVEQDIYYYSQHEIDFVKRKIRFFY